MPATSLVNFLSDGICPVCGSGFKNDRVGRGFVVHRDHYIDPQTGHQVPCPWHKGTRDHPDANGTVLKRNSKTGEYEVYCIDPKRSWVISGGI